MRLCDHNVSCVFWKYCDSLETSLSPWWKTIQVCNFLNMSCLVRLHPFCRGFLMQRMCLLVCLFFVKMMCDWHIWLFQSPLWFEVRFFFFCIWSVPSSKHFYNKPFSDEFVESNVLDFGGFWKMKLCRFLKCYRLSCLHISACFARLTNIIVAWLILWGG